MIGKVIVTSRPMEPVEVGAGWVVRACFQPNDVNEMPIITESFFVELPDAEADMKEKAAEPACCFVKLELHTSYTIRVHQKTRAEMDAYLYHLRANASERKAK